MVRAIETVCEGNILLQPEVAKKMLGSMGKQTTKEITKKENIFNELTKKEYEIALLVGQGKSNKEISTLLYITRFKR